MKDQADIKYTDITKDMLGTRRQRPMYISEFHKFRKRLSMDTYPDNPHEYTAYFLTEIDAWICDHRRAVYRGLETFTHRDTILGTTHQLDELHHLHGSNIAVYRGEYKYHRRLTDFTVKQITHYTDLVKGDVFVVSYPSCITTGYHNNFDLLLDYCDEHDIPVHIDGAWFGQCRNFEFDVTHPAVKSVSVSLSKSLGMGSQRIGIRYTKEKTVGPISIMNDFAYANVSDMWLGVEAMRHFGPDFWWSNYEDKYTKVCADFDLKESNSIHLAWIWQNDDWEGVGIRTPLRFLIDGMFDERGTDAGLNKIEREERS